MEMDILDRGHLANGDEYPSHFGAASKPPKDTKAIHREGERNRYPTKLASSQPRGVKA